MIFFIKSLTDFQGGTRPDNAELCR